MNKQLTLYGEKAFLKLPSTRYQGSKAKIVEWIWSKINKLEFNSFLDVFGGTGVVAYYMKCMRKQVIYNDNLQFNAIIGKAIIENNSIKLPMNQFTDIWTKNPNIDYIDIISRNFKDIYYTDEENNWLDVTIQNIQRIKNIYERSLAYYALFQSCIIKRPFNLFHRKNLYIREADVNRSFGNKASWDKPFENHMIKFLNEVNDLVYNNHKQNKVYNVDAFDLPIDYDLVYLDPPYTSSKMKNIDYRNFYHFLEGITIYNEWEKNIDYTAKNNPLKKVDNEWNGKNKVINTFKDIIMKFKGSILVISYRNDGFPSINTIKKWVEEIKQNVEIYYLDNYKYALSNGRTSEVLIIGY